MLVSALGLWSSLGESLKGSPWAVEWALKELGCSWVFTSIYIKIDRGDQGDMAALYQSHGTPTPEPNPA